MKIKEIGDANKEVRDQIKEVCEIVYKKAKPLYKKYGIPLDGMQVEYGKFEKGIKGPKIKIRTSNNLGDYSQTANIEGINVSFGILIEIGREERNLWYFREATVMTMHEAWDVDIRKSLFAFNNHRGAVMQSIRDDEGNTPTVIVENAIDEAVQNIEKYFEFIGTEYRENYIMQVLNSKFEHEIKSVIKYFNTMFERDGKLDNFWNKVFDILIDKINNGDRRKAKKLIRLASEDKTFLNFCSKIKPNSMPLYDATQLNYFLPEEVQDIFFLVGD